MNKLQDKYLKTYKERRCDHRLYQAREWPSLLDDTIVIIPAYKENYAVIEETLSSLAIKDIHRKSEVMLLINYKENDTEEIKNQSHVLYEKLHLLGKKFEKALNLSLFIKELEGKKAGVGMARKILMDCAFLRFLQENKDGLIINLDADTLVSPSYLNSIKEQFRTDESMEAASIYFEHPLDSEAITNYELHLRYFINMQRWTGLPFAFQTVGSAMATRVSAYAKVGGMNIRQAGEDFYFLHKFSKRWSLGEVNDTCIMPSARVSDRVPFGTGKAVQEFVDGDKSRQVSYNPESFVVLKEWLEETIYNLISGNISHQFATGDECLMAFLKQNDHVSIIHSFIESTNKPLGRVKKFFVWFDAFKLFKYLHYARDNGRPDIELMTCIEKLGQYIKADLPLKKKEALYFLRKEDQSADFRAQWRADLMARLSSTSAS